MTENPERLYAHNRTVVLYIDLRDPNPKTEFSVSMDLEEEERIRSTYEYNMRREGKQLSPSTSTKGRAWIYD